MGPYPSAIVALPPMRSFSPCLLIPLFACGSTRDIAGDVPRLVVLVSVDQLASRVLDAALPHMSDDGFRRLIREGVSFPDCAYAHACSSTGPGHATLSTGASAAGHGIIGNEWRDPETGRGVYCAGQPGAQSLLPDGAGRDLGPDLLLAPTLGEGMKLHFGSEAKIVSVAWKDRSAILMGGPAADLAVWADTRDAQMITNRRYAVRMPDWLVAFNERGLPVSWFGWTWDLVADEAAYADLVDDRAYEGRHADGTRTLPQVLDGREPAPGPRYYSRFSYSPLSNELILETALAALEAMDLGGDSIPDLLCVGFSANDYIGHVFGPDGVETRDVLLRTDLQLARLLGELDDVVGPGQYLVLLSSDHGVGAIPEAAREAGLDAGRALFSRLASVAAEQALNDAFGPPELGSYILVPGTLYFDGAALQARGIDRLEAGKIAAAAIAKLDSIEYAVSTRELLAEGEPTDPLRATLRAAVHPDRSGDVLLVPRRNWIDPVSRASHGTAWDYDREVPFLAMGGGLRAGVECHQSVTPGIGVVLAARALDIPAPSGAVDEMPDGLWR